MAWLILNPFRFETGRGAYSTFTSSAQWVFNHNLKSSNVLVQCYDDARSLFMPDITITNTNTTTANLLPNQSGSMIVFKGKATTSFTSQTTVNFNHALGSSDILIQVFDDSNNEIIPDSIQVVDSNNITVIFSSSQSGRINISIADVSQTFSSANSWALSHDQGTYKVMGMCYDSSGYMVKPHAQTTTNKATIQVNFSSSLAGKMVISMLDKSPVTFGPGYPITATGGTSGFGTQAVVDMDNGTLWTWGNNQYGQLGDGTIANRSSPSSVIGGHVFSLVSRNTHFVALKNDGSSSWWAWGTNNYGQFGNNAIGYSSSPISIANGGHSFVKVSAGYNFTIALKADSSAWAWGANPNGQLGSNSIANRSSPVSVYGGHSFVDVQAGEANLGLKSDGTVWGWGYNTNGAVGDGTTASRSSPVSVLGDHSFVKISTGESRNFALKADGSAWGWGINTGGCLGDLSQNSRSSPVSVVGGHSFIQIAGGSNSTIALKSDGSAWVWGGNNLGSLGDGTTSSRSSPVSVIGGHSFRQIAMTRYVFIGIKSDGSAWTWGVEVQGELGAGSTSNATRTSPNSVVRMFYS